MNRSRPSRELAVIDAVILCGGLGTRLKTVVADRPKAMAMVQGRPFLDIIVDELIAQGMRRFILCVGFLKEQIIDHVSQRRDAEYLFAEEDRPLGTGGAIRNAMPLVRSEPFLVLNGDSFCRIDLAGMLGYHLRNDAAMTLAAAPAGSRRDGGNLKIAANGQLHAFLEKTGAGDSINAGIYLFRRAIVASWQLAYPFSLERDVLPQLVSTQPCFAYRLTGEFIDIGTPDRYRQAQDGLP
jgi:NDP-sugar pyrophosphorylase family protein